MWRRVRFRPPGVQAGRRIGPLGPFRGTLGLQWVIAPLLLGVLLAVAAWFLLRDPRPGPPWVPVGALAALTPDSAIAAGEGSFVGRMPDGNVFAVVADPGCSLALAEAAGAEPTVPGFGYVDCEQREFWYDGTPRDGNAALDLLPFRIHSGKIFIDPTARIER